MEDPAVIMAVSHFCCSPPTRSSETRAFRSIVSSSPSFLALRFSPVLFSSLIFSLFEFGGTRMLHLAALFTRLTNLRHH